MLIVDSYYVNATSYSITLPNSFSTQTLDMGPLTSFTLLDSGTTVLYLPGGMVSQICGALSGTLDQGLCAVDCSTRTANSGGLNISISGSPFHIPYNNLIFPPDNSSSTYCEMLMAEADDENPQILGTPFLRSVYAVFDWDHQQVSLAQKADCTTDVVAIGTGSGAVSTVGGCNSTNASGGTRPTPRCLPMTFVIGILSLFILR